MAFVSPVAVDLERDAAVEEEDGEEERWVAPAELAELRCIDALSPHIPSLQYQSAVEGARDEALDSGYRGRADVNGGAARWPYH